MTIAYVVGAFPKRSETFIAREIEALEAGGVSVEVFPLWRARGAAEEEAASHPVHRCSHWALWPQFRYLGANVRWQLRFAGCLPRAPRMALRALWDLSVALDMGHRMRALGVERVHAHFANAPSTAGWVAASVAGVPFGLAAHARDVFVEPQFLREKARAAECVVACNSAAAERATKLIDEADRGKVHLIHHGVPLDRFPFREERPDEEDPPLVLGVGRLVEKKGFVHLVRAMATLRDRARCWLIGDGPERPALARELEALGLGETVKLMGWMTPGELKMVAYELASVLAMPSVVARDGDRDGLPNVVVEAAAIGVPIVATPVGGMGDLVRDGETGLVAPPADAEALAATIGEVLDDPDAAAARAEQARAEVEQRFDAERCAAELMTALGIGP